MLDAPPLCRFLRLSSPPVVFRPARTRTTSPQFYDWTRAGEGGRIREKKAQRNGRRYEDSHMCQVREDSFDLKGQKGGQEDRDGADDDVDEFQGGHEQREYRDFIGVGTVIMEASITKDAPPPLPLAPPSPSPIPALRARLVIRTPRRIGRMTAREPRSGRGKLAGDIRSTSIVTLRLRVTCTPRKTRKSTARPEGAML